MTTWLSQCAMDLEKEEWLRLMQERLEERRLKKLLASAARVVSGGV